MASLLSLERREDVAIVTLQRPEKRNALSIDLRVELADAFSGLGDDPDVGALVLTGAGTAFCSGMDTTQFGGDRANRERLVETSIGCFRAVAQCPKPVVAAVMCIAETSTIPSATPEASTAPCTFSVIRMNSRRSSVLKVMYSVWDFKRPP